MQAQMESLVCVTCSQTGWGGGRVRGLQAGLGAPRQEHKVYCLKPPSLALFTPTTLKTPIIMVSVVLVS